MEFSSTPDEITASMALLGLSSSSSSSTSPPSNSSFEERNEETNQSKNSLKLKWKKRIRERNEKQRVEIEQGLKNNKETEATKMESSSSAAAETSKTESDEAPKIVGEEGAKARNDPRLTMEDRLLAERLCKLKSMAGEENSEDEVERALEMYECNGGVRSGEQFPQRQKSSSVWRKRRDDETN
ncbi:uncharacterized protein LOC133829480 isoform X2 [Humulus lupulus]|uniref:uncharacterized protein LOC133829480 isoform X2 n=1 Tax=Humulus lupulus TaxID=3486 RepID=UPI002B40683C|nr:uncharacterized protein LOC133829480 isoform X2 [Humulus lupulus]